jgi:hypothetical protein
LKVEVDLEGDEASAKRCKWDQKVINGQWGL